MMNGGVHSMTPTAGTFDIVLLRTFVEVVDAGGFGLAAEQLALTPSAVSGHIKRLERAAATTLLKRTTRAFQLTQAGELLYSYARSIVALEREARAHLRSAPKGRLRIGASEDFAGTWLPEILQAFQRWHPGVFIELKVGITADLVKALSRARLDVVFGKQCRGVAADAGHLLWDEELVWAYAAESVFEPSADIPLAMFPEPCVYRESAIAALAKARKPWRLVFESSSMAGCLAAARAGFAVTPVARSQLQEGLRALDRADGMYPLPRVQFYAFARAATDMADELIAAVGSAGKRQRFVGSVRIHRRPLRQS
jgi:DNA-binding transcriptional LysR family regulator